VTRGKRTCLGGENRREGLVNRKTGEKDALGQPGKIHREKRTTRGWEVGKISKSGAPKPQLGGKRARRKGEKNGECQHGCTKRCTGGGRKT